MDELGKIRRESVLIERISKTRVKYGAQRVSLFRKGRYAGWVNRKEFSALLRQGRGKVDSTIWVERKTRKVRLNPTVLTKHIVTKEKKGIVKIMTYTRRQRRYVTNMLVQKKMLPLKKETSRWNIFRFKGLLGRIGIKTTKIIEYPRNG
jgi:hypothetical protein